MPRVGTIKPFGLVLSVSETYIDIMETGSNNICRLLNEVDVVAGQNVAIINGVITPIKQTWYWEKDI